MALNIPIYRVVGAADRTFREPEEAIALAALWLDVFGSVWITQVTKADQTLHFILDDRGLLTVETTIAWRGSCSSEVAGGG